MARLHSIIGLSHNPNLPLRLSNPADPDEELLAVREAFTRVRTEVAAAQPDVLICVGNDHLNKLFLDNMPAFMIGKSPMAEGPWKWEVDMGLPSYKAPVDVGLAKDLIRGGFEHRVDFAYSDEFKIDHSHTVPLSLVRPEQDIPIVPIFCNVMAPPLATARRFYQVGLALREILDELPGSQRVVALCSGHLSVEIGGPRMRNGAVDPEFDRWSVDLVGSGDVEAVCREMTVERMLRAGNYTPGFLTFVMLLGMAKGRPASQVDLLPLGEGNIPFITWRE